MFRLALPILCPISNVCRALHRAVNTYVSQTDVALAGPMMNKQLFGYGDFNLLKAIGDHFAIEPELRSWSLPACFVDTSLISWNCKREAAGVNEAASSVTCLALNVDALPRSPVSLGYFSCLESVHIFALNTNSASKVAAAFAVVQAIAASPEKSSLRSLHIKTSYKVCKMIENLGNWATLGNSLTSFILEFQPDVHNNSPLMKVHWRWDATTANGGIPVSDILSSLLVLCSAKSAPTWEEIVTWNLDRVGRLRSCEEEPDFCNKLNRLLSSPRRVATGAFPTL